MNTAPPLTPDIPHGPGLFAQAVDDPEDPTVDFRSPEMREREELVCRREGLRHEVSALVGAMEYKRALYRDHRAAQQAFGELCANGSRFGLVWEIAELERLLLDVRRALGDAGINAERVLRRANDATVVLQIIEPKCRLRNIFDPRVRVPDRFRLVWAALYRRASRREDRIVRTSLTSIAKSTRLETHVVRQGIEFLDGIGVIVTIVAPEVSRWKDGTTRTQPGKYEVRRLQEIDRIKLAERIEAMPPEAFLANPKDAARKRRWWMTNRSKHATTSSSGDPTTPSSPGVVEAPDHSV